MNRLILFLAFVCLSAGGLAGCKKDPPATDSAVTHTAESIHKQIQGLRLELMEAMKKNELQYIHDNMYYFQSLLQTLAGQVDPEKKQTIDRLLADLRGIAQAIDNSAGRGNQAATEANLQKLIDRLQELESHFQGSTK